MRAAILWEEDISVVTQLQRMRNDLKKELLEDQPGTDQTPDTGVPD